MMQTRSDSSPTKATPQNNLDLSSTTSGEGLDVSLNSSSGSIYPPPSFYPSPYSRTVKTEPKEDGNFTSPSFQSPQETQNYYPKPDLSAMGYSMNSGQQNTASMFMAAAAYAYAAGCQNQMEYNWQSPSRYPTGYQSFYSYDSHSYPNIGPDFSSYQRSFASADERTRECVNCGVVDTSIWKMDENGLFLCNECYRAHKGSQPRTTDHEPASTEEVDESQKSLSSQASSLNFLEQGAAEKDEGYRSHSFEDGSNSGTSSKTGANSSNRKPVSCVALFILGSVTKANFRRDCQLCNVYPRHD
ncbi:hypothetical protein Ciccas_009533 [Cichlidogyrus casuarinus]|uniref:GATA-type domain-containing protein n=1 Tax=Cichlidogyrus casuarinus TaxID=1844966 RepID=A0ABD2PWR4_9PLAT